MLAHGLVALAIVIGIGVDSTPRAHQIETVDIELAPPPPPVEALPAETAKPIAKGAEPVAAAPAPKPAADEAALGADAGIDAAPPADAARRIARKADAAEDVAMLSVVGGERDADAGSGSATEVAGIGSADGSATGSADAGSGSGVPAAVAVGSGSGAPGMDDEPAVAGAATSPGTAANLLAYLPTGHVLAVLVRFDRLRGTEWAPRTEALFQAMPDYAGLFGARDADIADKLDMLAISTPEPRDVTATTLVMHTQLARPAIRTLLGGNVTWSTARGGALGTRAAGFAGDRRVVLSPWRGWYLLAQPDDLGADALAKSGGDVDTREASVQLPAWLAQIRSIATESGDDVKGPALVMTIGGAPLHSRAARTGRVRLPDVGLGVDSLPVPQRLSLAMELVPQGWLLRGNIVFASEAEAAELASSIGQLQQSLLGSRLLSALLAKQHVLAVVKNLSVARAGARISYATSMSIADARAVLTAAKDALHP
ncbi:MAG TPA: hypothetical protein VGL61_23935 [Kofleriaceae bacterium]